MSDTVIGGEQAIAAAGRLLAEERRGDRSLPAIGVDQIREQMALAVDRVMSEGSIYDPELAALALKQAWGDISEAIFLLRAYRTTLPRFGASPADRHGEDADPPPGLVDVQGSARRPGARRHFRLQPETARFRTARPRRGGRQCRRSGAAKRPPSDLSQGNRVSPRRGPGGADRGRRYPSGRRPDLRSR